MVVRNYRETSVVLTRRETVRSIRSPENGETENKWRKGKGGCVGIGVELWQSERARTSTDKVEKRAEYSCRQSEVPG